MPNLNKGQTAWTNLWREFVQYLRTYRLPRDMARRFQRGRTRVYETMDVNNFLSLWTFTGAKRGVNCAEDGRLWITLTDETPGAGQAKVSVYMDAAKSSKVAEGSAADGATATLAAQNNSGLTGTVKLATISSTVTAIVLLLDIDETAKSTNAFDLSTQGGIAAFNSILASINGMGTTLVGKAGAAKGDIERSYIAVKLAEFLKSSARNTIQVTETPDSNGDVQLLATGILADLVSDMNDDTTPQSVKANVVAAGSPSYDPDNVGSGTLNSLGVRQNALNGTITLTCKSGFKTTLSEAFDVLIKTDDGPVIRAKNQVIVHKEWESAVMGIRLRLDRAITDDDTSNQLSAYVISGETTINTDAGDLYAKVLALSPPVAGNNRRVILYSDAARQLVVAQGDRSGDGTVTLVEQNNSGLSGSVVLAYSGDDNTIVVHLNPFDVNDVIEIATTNDGAGKIQSLFCELWGYPIPTNVSPTIPDSLLDEAVDHILAVS